MAPKDPETSVINYHCSLRNDPEERSSHLLRGGNVKFRGDFIDQIRKCLLIMRPVSWDCFVQFASPYIPLR